MIGELLPQAVRCSATRTDHAAPGALFPQEESLLKKAVSKRRNEFRTVRVCARLAMADLGLPPVPVLRGPRGEPQWPAGVVGSMTHCEGYRAAAVARTDDIRTLGIDAEPHGPLPEGVLDVIALPSEQARLARDLPDGAIHWDRLLFSAKESVFKAWYPVTGVDLGFHEADLTFRQADGATTRGVFTARLLRPVPAAPQEFCGQWLVRDGLALTAVVIPRG
ncbi:4'-phosphopantetheinyl transferase family protein [Streptomyces jeddahensis]|uniref:4'-phosphopantetheinyl transferase Npt n=1 Tax=Streptomyces jeddahensis TaxID=1716141 RepID=A0A177HR33_9ACTN|nr:4'-phosphopantetheinyl transferase superfamily protein [Streptomyces jeddahensis]OAH13472.1 4'-phosphopantetheinyl transferase Npt [Streptomyces jeddahensis]